MNNKYTHTTWHYSSAAHGAERRLIYQTGGPGQGGADNQPSTPSDPVEQNPPPIDAVEGQSGPTGAPETPARQTDVRVNWVANFIRSIRSGNAMQALSTVFQNYVAAPQQYISVQRQGGEGEQIPQPNLQPGVDLVGATLFPGIVPEMTPGTENEDEEDGPTDGPQGDDKIDDDLNLTGFVAEADEVNEEPIEQEEGENNGTETGIEYVHGSAIIIDSDGTVWYRETGAAPNDPWQPLLEDDVQEGDERNGEAMQKKIEDGRAFELEDTELTRMENAIENESMRGDTFISTDGSEWYCQHAGQLRRLDVRNPSARNKIYIGREPITIPLNYDVAFRSPIELPGGAGQVGPNIGDSAETDGVSFKRVEGGIEITASADAMEGVSYCTVFGSTLVNLDIADLAKETVSLNDIENMEVGKRQDVSGLQPPEAIVRIPNNAGTGELELGSAHNATIENQYIKVERNRTYGYLRITAKAETPDGSLASLTVVGEPDDGNTFEVLPVATKLLDWPGQGIYGRGGRNNIPQGGTHSVSRIEPKSAIALIHPTGGGSPVRLEAENNATITVDGVQYRRWRPSDGTYDYVSITASASAPVGQRRVEAEGATGDSASTEFNIVSAQATPSPTPNPFPSAPTAPQNPERYTPRNYLLPEPGDYEENVEGGPRVPEGTVRITIDGVAYEKRGEGGSFTGWRALSPGEATTRNHPYMRTHSAIQVSPANRETVLNAVSGTTIQEGIYTWTYRVYPGESELRWGASL